MKKKVLAALLCAAMSYYKSCTVWWFRWQRNRWEKGSESEFSGELVIALWDNRTMELFESLDLEGRFQEYIQM